MGEREGRRIGLWSILLAGSLHELAKKIEEVLAWWCAGFFECRGAFIRGVGESTSGRVSSRNFQN